MKTASKVYTALIFIFLYAPIIVLIIFSFNDTDTASRTQFSGFTLRWYQRLFEDRYILEALTAEVLGTYEKDFYAGEAALTKNKFGKGEAYYIAARTGSDMLSRRYRHNGYMTEALRAMVQNAFEVMNVEVVAISHFVGNEPSRKVIERAGFIFEGVMPCGFKRFDGEIFDNVCYSILRSEYDTGLISSVRRMR